ncbi:MAG: 50S ribosomal protein L9 [Alphaproteobacteria bacterium]|nr:MAG: 50S ribosomal protein L9 [Alphaproteobacteria bacterium]
MELILLERVPHLGQMGDIVNVKPGYARNYLLPQKKALRATEENRKFFEAQRKEIEAQNLKRRQEAEAVAAKMEGLRLVLVRQAGESGQLYGSASARDIAESLKEAGYTVGRSQVELSRPIKEIGIHEVKVRLHPEVALLIKVNVARSEAEAEQQWTIGGAVPSEPGEAEAAAEAAEAAEEEVVDADKLVADLLEESARAGVATSASDDDAPDAGAADAAD